MKSSSTVALSWSFDADVSKLGPGDSLEITFEAKSIGTIYNSSMGEVKLLLHHPFRYDVDTFLDGSETGLVFTERNYTVRVTSKIVAGYSAAPTASGAPVSVSRSQPTGENYTAVHGRVVAPRVEIHPVVPVPQPGQMPPRAMEPRTAPPGTVTPHAAAVPLSASLPLNALCNPSLIPILQPTQPGFDKLAARLAVTYYRPHDLNQDLLTWFVRKGPVQIHGASRGLSVLAYATSDSQSLAEIELRWDGASGPVLCVFRAFVGYVKRIPFRANIIQGPTKSPASTPAHVHEHIGQATVLLYQAGLRLVADPDPTSFDGAVASAHAGIFTVPSTDAMTHRVPRGGLPDAMRLNWRPGVLNLLYIGSFDRAGLAGVATDRPGLSGGEIEVGGTPSSSWVSPTGVPPDEDAETVTMLSMSASNVRSTAADLACVRARGLAPDSLAKMWGVTLPAYTVPTDPDWGQTVAHEIGHVLGLRHRGNGATDKAPGSDDEINDPTGKGHPWQENVMCYGYTLSQDLDLVQTKCLRHHPLAKGPFPAAPTPAPAPAPTPTINSEVVKLQNALGETPADGVWKPATEALARAQMVRRGSTGPVVFWVQERLTALGFPCGTPDSKAGEKTEKAIERFQRSRTMLDDGVAGPTTMKALAGVP